MTMGLLVLAIVVIVAFGPFTAFTPPNGLSAARHERTRM
jgi:hypothetical protein